MPKNSLGARSVWSVNASADQRYFIQATTNLVDWVNLSTNMATGAYLESVDVDAAAFPYRFYRWQAAE